MQAYSTEIPQGQVYCWDIPPSRAIMRDHLLAYICIEFEVTREQIYSRGGVRKVTDAKKAYTLLAREALHDTYMRIGLSIQKDYTNVIHLHREACKLATLTNDYFPRKVAAIKSKLFNQSIQL